MKRGSLVLSLVCGLALLALARPAAGEEAMRVRVELGKAGQALVLLNDSEAARNFYAMLPLSLTFEDFNGTEKIATLSKKLDFGASPTSCDPKKGSLAYFIPWGNIAVFYKDFRPSRNLVPLGTIVQGIELFEEQEGDFSARVERAQ